MIASRGFVLVALVAWSGCGLSGLGQPCTKTTDCALTLTCDGGVCRDPLDPSTCIVSGSSTTCVDNAECCSNICLSIDDECHASCTRDSDCDTRCCATLNQGVKACVAESECF